MRFLITLFPLGFSIIIYYNYTRCISLSKRDILAPTNNYITLIHPYLTLLTPTHPYLTTMKLHLPLPLRSALLAVCALTVSHTVQAITNIDAYYCGFSRDYGNVMSSQTLSSDLLYSDGELEWYDCGHPYHDCTEGLHTSHTEFGDISYLHDSAISKNSIL